MFSKRSKISALGAVLVFGVSAGFVAAQNPAPVLEGHPEDYSQADITYGARIYAEQCNRCHGADGTGVSGVDFRSGKFKNAATDRQLTFVITTGFPTAGMPAFKLDASELTGLIAFLRNINRLDSGTLKGGDAVQGKLIFEGKGKCLDCHQVNGKGSRKAPNLSDIGAIRSAGTIERELVSPDEQMMPINRPVHVVTKEGKTIDGRRLNEDTYTVQMMDQEGRLHSLVKSDLREFKISTRSNMPSFKGDLTPAELSDVVAYLVSMKGQ